MHYLGQTTEDWFIYQIIASSIRNKSGYSGYSSFSKHFHPQKQTLHFYSGYPRATRDWQWNMFLGSFSKFHNVICLVGVDEFLSTFTLAGRCFSFTTQEFETWFSASSSLEKEPSGVLVEINDDRGADELHLAHLISSMPGAQGSGEEVAIFYGPGHFPLCHWTVTVDDWCIS